MDLVLPLEHPWFVVAGTALAAVAIAMAVHRIGAMVLRRLTRHRPLLGRMVRDAYTPARWTLIAFALQLVWQGAPDTLHGIVGTRDITRLVFIATVTWLLVRCCTAVGHGVVALHPADGPDNLTARRIHTQTQVLIRCANFAILLVGVAAMLMTFPEVRQIGASIMASAGLVGIVAGLAARPVLGNLIAGLQIAITQPIRIDDVLIVQGEWGRVQEITGAYVVVRLWDERRLIVPLQWFIENPFQNWTRSTASLIGSVFLWLDYRMPLEPLRKELERLCKDAGEWDRRVCVLQVTDTSTQAMQVRALVSASDSSKAWDLRCKIREGLVAYVQRHHADCLPRLRAELGSKPDVGGRAAHPPRELSSPTV
jgi:small-conductance mechanosensitive channel